MPNQIRQVVAKIKDEGEKDITWIAVILYPSDNYDVSQYKKGCFRGSDEDVIRMFETRLRQAKKLN